MIRFWDIDFYYGLGLLDLDTSATLSPQYDEVEGILLFAKAKRSKNFCKDSHFVRICFYCGLLRRIVDSPRNDEILQIHARFVVDSQGESQRKKLRWDF